MMYKIKTKDELYVYFNGKLIFKRYIKHGYSKVFSKWGEYAF